MMTGLIELMMTMRMMMPVLIDAKRWGDHDDRGNHLGLFVPSSVSVSVSEPVGQEEELRGVEGSEKERLSRTKK